MLIRPRLTRLSVLAALSLASVAAAQNTEANQRCAIRLSSALLGRSAEAALLSSTNPQGQVDALLSRAEFIERFARFINARFNREPGVEPAEDATYYLAKHVLTNSLPWKDLFVGKFRVDRGATATADAVVVSDTNGLGYFRSPVWMRRYAGNEVDGYRLVTAYLMLNNTIGVKLVAAVNTDGINAAGRMSTDCAGCHYNPTYGLDLIAKILSRRVGTGESMTFRAPTEIPQTFLDGKSLSSDAQFINALVASEDFRFNACRLATEFLYGRAEYQCEGPVFDRCVNAFTTQQTLQSAVAAIAKDPSFCQ